MTSALTVSCVMRSSRAVACWDGGGGNSECGSCVVVVVNRVRKYCGGCEHCDGDSDRSWMIGGDFDDDMMVILMII